MHIHATNPGHGRPMFANIKNVPPGHANRPHGPKFDAGQPPALDTQDGAPPANDTTTQQSREPGTVSLSELLKNWGKNGSEADLNQDGVVDANDLAILLGSLQGDDPEPEPSPVPITTSVPPSTSEPAITTTAPESTEEPAPGIASEAPSATETPVTDAGQAPVDAETKLTTDSGEAAPVETETKLTADTGEAAPADAGATEPSPDVQQLLKEWGQSDSDYDLNGDGTVNAVDLALLLGGQQIAGDEDLQGKIDELTTSAAAKVETDPALSGVAARLPQAIADAIFKANGHEGADRISVDDLEGPSGMLKKLDADGDGFIDRSELEAAITSDLKSVLEENPEARLGYFAKRWYEAFSDAGTVGDPGNPLPKAIKSDGAIPRPAVINPVKLRHAAEALTTRLQNLGFEAHAPKNIADVLDRFNLNRSERKIMLNHLSRRFPDGLGVNQVG